MISYIFLRIHGGTGFLGAFSSCVGQPAVVSSDAVAYAIIGWFMGSRVGKAGALITCLAASGAILYVSFVESSNGAMAAELQPAPKLGKTFSQGQGASELLADVSALMIAADGKIKSDELAFARTLAGRPELLISGQGTWSISSSLLKGFSEQRYLQQLETNLESYSSYSGAQSWSAPRVSEAATDILNSARSLEHDGSVVAFVSAGASVWAKQIFEQSSPEESHEDIRQRERVNLHF